MYRLGFDGWRPAIKSLFQGEVQGSECCGGVIPVIVGGRSFVSECINSGAPVFKYFQTDKT